MLETDAPYIRPRGSAYGSITHPSVIGKVARYVAEIKNMPPEIILGVSAFNASKLFKLGPLEELKL